MGFRARFLLPDLIDRERDLIWRLCGSPLELALLMHFALSHLCLLRLMDELKLQFQ